MRKNKFKEYDYVYVTSDDEEQIGVIQGTEEAHYIGGDVIRHYVVELVFNEQRKLLCKEDILRRCDFIVRKERRHESIKRNN